MSKRLKHFVTISVLGVVLPVLSHASDSMSYDGQLSRWYTALGAEDGEVDADIASALLSDQAVIDLKDLGITQSKSEFIDSLESWSDAIEGGNIVYKFPDDMNDTVKVNVCYMFQSGPMLTIETFTFEDDLILTSEQISVSDVKIQGHCE